MHAAGLGTLYTTAYFQQPRSSQITLRIDLGLCVTSHFTYSAPLQGEKKMKWNN